MRGRAETASGKCLGGLGDTGSRALGAATPVDNADGAGTGTASRAGVGVASGADGGKSAVRALVAAAGASCQPRVSQTVAAAPSATSKIHQGQRDMPEDAGVKALGAATSGSKSGCPELELAPENGCSVVSALSRE